MSLVKLVFCFSLAFFARSLESNCTETRTVYTECSEAGAARWRVTVSEETNCTLPPPERVASCDKTCPEGQVLDNFTDCVKCEPGTYSSGDTKVIGVLDPTVYPEVTHLSTKINFNGKSCPKIKVEQGHVVLPTSLCYNEVNVPFKLVQPGTVTLNFLYTDSRVNLQFYVKDARSCDSEQAIRNKAAKADDEWQNVQLEVPSKGRYMLQVRSTAFFNTEPATSHPVPLETPLLGNLTVTGVEPLTKCIVCREGYIAKESGSGACSRCPGNQIPDTAHTTCSSCQGNQYSSPGDVLCSDKVTCEEDDFVPVVGKCVEGKSLVELKEKIPGRCNNTANPLTYDCLECGPGMEKKGGECRYCPEGTHNSNGGPVCTSCDTNTVPLKGQYYTWWDEVPTEWSTRCKECWVPAGPFILGKTTTSHPVVILNFGDVRFSTKEITKNIVGLFSVSFKLFCPNTCTLMTIKTVTQKKSWVTKQEYLHKFENNTKQDQLQNVHSFVYKHDTPDANTAMDFSLKLSGYGAYMHLHEVNFTNTVVGGSSFCFPCNGSSCQQCSPGMVSEGGKCVLCPENTYHLTSGSVLEGNYSSTCEQCPSGTHSTPGSTSCYMKCDLTTPSGLSYSLGNQSSTLSLDGKFSYPDEQGKRLHYRYKLKLCSDDSTNSFVACSDDSVGKNVKGVACRENVRTFTNGTEQISNPVVTGEMLTGIFEKVDGVTLQYSTLHAHHNCDRVSTNVTLLCNRDQTGDIRLVHDADDCRQGFEYSGPFGCRLCNESDYRSITSSCEAGSQNTTYVLIEGVVCVGGVATPTVVTATCTPAQETLMESMKRYKLYVGLGVGLLLFLLTGLFLLACYSSSLKHKLDGYSRMDYADDDGDYKGVTQINKNSAWADSDDETDQEENLFARYECGNSSGNSLTKKLGRISQGLGLRKYQQFPGNDIMMTSRLGI